MKTFIFIALCVSMFWSIFWYMGYKNLFELDVIERQTYAIMANIKWLTVIALYVAWRVTPESKSK